MFIFAPMTETDARAIGQWHYAEPYAIYSMTDDAESIAEMLDPRSPHYAVCDGSGVMIGFFAYGTAAEVGQDNPPALFVEDTILNIGLGLRPDMTGKGFGLDFVNAGLDFARHHFAPHTFRLYVMTYNERAIRVYERAGFQHGAVFVVRNAEGDHEFMEMHRPV